MVYKAALSAAAALALALALPAPAASQSAHSACTHATIAGLSKCLARGQFCTPGYQRQYQRYHFSCKPDGHGRYRLR
jgi:hypothetical protein